MNIGISRRCGYICEAWWLNHSWYYAIAHSNHNGWREDVPSSYKRYVNCSRSYNDRGVGFDDEYAPCTDLNNLSSDGRRWLERTSCPKGWGKNRNIYGNDSESVMNSQGYVSGSISVPVYGYVTRYRDAYYNYIGGRISKT